MTVTKAALAAGLLAGAALACGCSRDPGQATPRDVVLKMQRMLVAGDKKGYADCFTGSERSRTLILAMYDFVRAGYEFQDAFTAAYGQKAWEDFQDDEGVKLSLPRRDDAWAKGLTIDVKGDRAVVTAPGRKQEMIVVRKEGRWMIDADSGATAGDPMTAARVMTRMATALRAAKGEIGKPGVSGEDLDRALGDAFRKIMTEKP
jgi:hypothetical protein